MSTPPTVWFMDTVNMQGFNPGFYIDISDHVPMKVQMLACHQSQLARGDDGDFSPLADLMRRQAEMRGSQAGVKAAEAFRIHDTFKRCGAW